ncbi:hypothetical protein GEMRC1_003285 [Eukaryota sp. GEM-RC1]
MKLDASLLRYLTHNDIRILTAVEMGMKNHDLVPVELVERISGLSRGETTLSLKNVHKNKLVHHEGQPYDGYTLLYSGYDMLALNTLVKRGVISSFGHKFGVGKEADIYCAANDEGTEVVVKLHRLGRTSFRAVKNKRDYLQHRRSASWLYMARLAAHRESSFMNELHSRGFPVPKLLGYNRHVVVMERIHGFPLTSVSNINEPPGVEFVFRQIVDNMVALLHVGLVHGDFNEFNLILNKKGNVTIIDFPQMISIDHNDAKSQFERDLECCLNFFQNKFGYAPETLPSFDEEKEKVDRDQHIHVQEEIEIEEDEPVEENAEEPEVTRIPKEDYVRNLLKRQMGKQRPSAKVNRNRNKK